MKKMFSWILAFFSMIVESLRSKQTPLPRHLAVLRPMHHDEPANVQLILMAVVAAIVIAVSIIIVYSVLAGIDYDTIDRGMGWNGSALDLNRPATNASNSLMTNLATFYSVSPIYIVVLAAVGIISAIMMIVITRK